jgi:ankyrin repeat protein
MCAVPTIVRCFYVAAACQTDGTTPLYIASLHGHVEAVRALVEAGAAVNQAKVRDGWVA